jgi:hypothetical protein
MSPLKIAIIVLFVLGITVVIYQHLSGKKLQYTGVDTTQTTDFFYTKKKHPFPVPPRKFQSEEECRNIIEFLTGEKFPKIRPDFLQYPKTGNNLELDGYCPELRIAFEYNGKQHYSFVPYFHKSYDDFMEQIKHDNFKKERCHNLGIRLIVVPYNVKNITKYIYEELKKIEEIENQNIKKGFDDYF